MKKVTLIYDDDEFAFLYKAMVAKHDFVVEKLPKCENILSDIQTFNPSVILIDL